MNATLLQWIRRGLWVIVALFLAASGAVAYTIHAEMRPSAGVLYCGNCITDPLGLILNVGAPLAAITISGLAYFTVRAGDKILPVASVGILGMAVIGGFVAFGIRFFRDVLPGHSLSSIVWWMF